MKYNNVYPISDNAMVYDRALHMYVLQPQYVKQRTGVDLSLLINSPYVVDKTTAVNNLLSDISEQIYNYVYSYNHRYNDYQEYLMAKSPEARGLILNALLKQLAYIMRNGKIDEFAGINMSYTQNNASLDLKDVRGERAIHPEAISILSRPIECGEKLLYTGNYILPNDLTYRVDY